MNWQVSPRFCLPTCISSVEREGGTGTLYERQGHVMAIPQLQLNAQHSIFGSLTYIFYPKYYECSFYLYCSILIHRYYPPCRCLLRRPVVPRASHYPRAKSPLSDTCIYAIVNYATQTTRSPRTSTLLINVAAIRRLLGNRCSRVSMNRDLFYATAKEYTISLESDFGTFSAL